MIYGDIERTLEYEITKGSIITCILGKNKHWTDGILKMVNWKGIGMCLDKMEDTKVINVLKLVNRWQNDGQ